MTEEAVPKFERLMNLVAFLLASPEPVPFAVIRKLVVGYSDLAREDAVEKRFDRDKKELREIGIPVEYVQSDEQGRDGYYIPREQYFHTELDLDEDEAAVLVMLANSARGGNDAISSNLRSALLKMAIDSPLQEEVANAISQRRVHSFTRGRRDRAVLDNLDRLVAAVAGRRVVKFRYRKMDSKKVTERLVHPYGLGYREGEWYLVGEDQEKRALRQFKVVRIHGAVQQKKGGARGPAFKVPAGFDIEKHIARPPWEYAGGKAEAAEIRFHPDVAWMVAENLVPGQQFDTKPDGSGVLKLKVKKAPDTHAKLLNYLAAYSGQCSVASPPWLKKQAMAHLKALRERYD
ncbi:MAG: helix-turn-helix transcriptional regulator [Planctomycetota bacterium]